MNLKHEDIRKIRGLILFAAFVMACVWKYDEIFRIISFVFHIFLPFILGGAIAFVLNVPMDFVERHLFKRERIEKVGKWSKVLVKIKRPVSLLIVLAILIGAIALILFVLIPQLVYTFTNLGKSMQELLDYIQKKILHSNISSSIVSQFINRIQIDGNQILEKIFYF